MRRGRPHAFTLVELLVVVGIIAVLVAILLPVLGRAREQARAVQCASNIGQIWKACLMYANENGGVLPMPAGSPDSRLTPIGLASCGIRYVQPGWLNYHEGALWRYVGSTPEERERLFLCPTDDEPRFAGKWPFYAAVDTNYPRNFSYNFSPYMAQAFWMAGLPRAGLPLARIRRPSTKILIFEQENPAFPQGGLVAGYSQNPGQPAGPSVFVRLTRRHSGRANAGFGDGHVESIDPRTINTSVPDVHSVEAWQVYENVVSDR